MNAVAITFSAAVASLLAGFVGVFVGLFVGFVAFLGFGVALTSLPLFGAGGAAVFAVWGAYAAVRRAAAGVPAADWAADDVVEDGPAFDEDFTGMMLPPGAIPGPTDTPARSR